jgi:hypothetical protein
MTEHNHTKSVSELLSKKEFKVIAGKSNRQLMLLSGILILTLVAIGFAVKSVAKLEQSMKDPFTMWIDVVLDSRTRDSLPSIIEDYTSEVAMAQYSLLNIKPYAVDWWDFIGADGNTYQRRGRQVDADSDLVREVLKGSRDIDTLEYYLGDCGLIVEEDMLYSLGFNNPELVRTLEAKVLDRLIYINVVAVVKQLPNQSDFLVSTGFYNMKNKTGYDNGMFQAASNIHYVHTAFKNAEGIGDSLRPVFDMEAEMDFDIELIDSILTATSEKRFIYKVRFPIQSELPSTDAFVEKVNEMSGNSITGYINWNCAVTDDNAVLYSPDWLAFHFGQLEQVGGLRENLKKNYGLEISMGKVRSAENFGRVSQMTFIIAGMLWLFGVISAILFINNQFRTHLERSRANLGTLKAFGMANGLLRRIYIRILSKFLLISASLAYGVVLVLQMIDMSVYGNTAAHINVINWYALSSLLGVIVITLLVTSRTVRGILGGTPGDLIYDRR